MLRGFWPTHVPNNMNAAQIHKAKEHNNDLRLYMCFNDYLSMLNCLRDTCGSSMQKPCKQHLLEVHSSQ